MSMLNTATSASTLQLWACWLSHNVSSVYFLKHVSYSAASACSLMLSFLDSIFFDLNFHAHFLLFLCLTDFILVFEILIKSTTANSYSALCHVFKKSFVCFSFSSHVVFLFEISVKSTFTSWYSISCSIFRKDFLFASSNFQFRNANFSSICIQHMRVNLTNLINEDLTSSVNQIQLEADNQL